jgi:hypothetical protein
MGGVGECAVHVHHVCFHALLPPGDASARMAQLVRLLRVAS